MITPKRLRVKIKMWIAVATRTAESMMLQKISDLLVFFMSLVLYYSTILTGRIKYKYSSPEKGFITQGEIGPLR